MKREEPVTLDRRQYLQLSGGVGVLAASGQSCGFVPPTSSPRPKHVWISVQESGSAKFVAEFESDAECLFNWPVLSKELFEKEASKFDEFPSFRFEDVDVETAPSSLDPNHVLSGTIDSFAYTDTMGDTRQRIIENPSYHANKSQFSQPIRLFLGPLDPSSEPYLTMTYPSGYTYNYPAQQNTNSVVEAYENSPLAELDKDISLPHPVFSTPDQQYDVQIPEIYHRDNRHLGWAGMMSKLKRDVLESGWKLFSYRENTRRQPVQAAVEFGQRVGHKLGEEAILMVLSEPLPPGVSAIDDISSVSSALDPDTLLASGDDGSVSSANESGPAVDGDAGFLENLNSVIDTYFSGDSDTESTTTEETTSSASSTQSRPTDSILDSMDALLKEGWFHAALPEGRAQSNSGTGETWSPISLDETVRDLSPQHSGFATLAKLSEIEALLIRRELSTEHLRSANDIRDVYLEALRHHRSIASEITARLTTYSFEEPHWEKRNEYAKSLSRNLTNISDAQIEAVREGFPPR